MDIKNIENKMIIKKVKNNKVILLIVSMSVVILLLLYAIIYILNKDVNIISEQEFYVIAKSDEKLTTIADRWIKEYFKQYQNIFLDSDMRLSEVKIEEIENINEENNIVRVKFYLKKVNKNSSYFKEYGEYVGNKLKCDMLLTLEKENLQDEQGNEQEKNDSCLKVSIANMEIATQEKIIEYKASGAGIKTNKKLAKNPVVPDGFKKIDTDNAKWDIVDDEIIDYNKGLVIEDETGNQFVWIPVDNEKIIYEFVEDENTWEDALPDGITSEKEQIEKYGGFYIARYEAGVPKEFNSKLDNISNMSNNVLGIPVSKSGVRPWNYIEYKNAKKNAESMYVSDKLKSGLITNTQWNTVMSFLETNSYDIKSKSYKFGNYSASSDFEFSGLYSIDGGTSYIYGENIKKSSIVDVNGKKNVLLSCGATPSTMTCNIYDLFGNLSELTTRYAKGYCEMKGGDYNNVFSNHILQYREPNARIGFRVILYML